MKGKLSTTVRVYSRCPRLYMINTIACRKPQTWVLTHVCSRICYTHPFNGPFLRLPGWAGTRKVKPIWILLKQETVSGSGSSWAICKSAPRSRQITTPAPQHSVFLQARCPSCCPTNSVKALKATDRYAVGYATNNNTVTLHTTIKGWSTVLNMKCAG